MPQQLTDDRIRTLAAEFLGTSVQPPDDVIEGVFVALGLDPNDDTDLDDYDLDYQIVDAVLDSDEFVEVEEGLAHLPSLLDGTTWVVPVTAEGATTGALPVHALGFLSFLLEERPLPVVDGSGAPTGGRIELENAPTDDEGWTARMVGPDRWLTDAADRFVALSLGPDWSVSVETLDHAPDADTALTEAVAAVFAQCATIETFDDRFHPDLPFSRDDADRDDGSERADWLADIGHDDEGATTSIEFAATAEVLLEVLAHHRELLLTTPVPPVDALAAAAGYEVDGPLIAPIGFDWDAFARWQQTSHISSHWRLDAASTQFVQMLLGIVALEIEEEATALDSAFDAADVSVDQVRSVFGLGLDQPGVAEAFWGENVHRGVPREQLLAFVQRIIDADPDRVLGGVRWLAAKYLDHLGRPLEAEAVLQEAADGADDDHPLAMEMLAGFRSDRGDAPGALRLLQRSDDIDVDDIENLKHHPLLSEIGGFATQRPKAPVGRNEACPCGSGRKYKKCHMGQERHPLYDRANWLYLKMVRYVTDNRFRMRHAAICEAIVESSGAGPGMLLRLLDLPLTADLTLSRCGAGAAFATERAALLPDDEAVLASQWSTVEPSVFKIVTRTDSTLDLLDLRSGQQLAVTNTIPSSESRPEMVVYGRPLPFDATWRAMSGFTKIAEPQLDALIAALDGDDVIELARRIGAAFPPPETESDPRAWIPARQRQALGL